MQDNDVDDGAIALLVSSARIVRMTACNSRWATIAWLTAQRPKRVLIYYWIGNATQCYVSYFLLIISTHNDWTRHFSCPQQSIIPWNRTSRTRFVLLWHPLHHALLSASSCKHCAFFVLLLWVLRLPRGRWSWPGAKVNWHKTGSGQRLIVICFRNWPCLSHKQTVYEELLCSSNALLTFPIILIEMSSSRQNETVTATFFRVAPSTIDTPQRYAKLESRFISFLC